MEPKKGVWDPKGDFSTCWFCGFRVNAEGDPPQNAVGWVFSGVTAASYLFGVNSPQGSTSFSNRPGHWLKLGMASIQSKWKSRKAPQPKASCSFPTASNPGRFRGLPRKSPQGFEWRNTNKPTSKPSHQQANKPTIQATNQINQALTWPWVKTNEPILG